MKISKSSAPIASEKIIEAAIKNTEAEGFFGPNSMHWKLYREPGLLVAGISALLLQIAHPAVAIGVHQYSEFKKDFLGRAHRTIVSMTSIWLGSKTEALASAQRLYHIHSHIKGVIPVKQKGKIIERYFCANDPDLLLWVLSTMTMATVEAYEKIYRPLSAEELQLYYEETKITAQLMGIPLEAYPVDWVAFEKYYQDFLAGDFLEVGTKSKNLARDIFKAYFPFSYLMRVMAAGFLTSKLNQQFDLKFRKREQLIFKGVNLFTKIIMKCTPDKMRFAPHYHRANYRIVKANGNTPSLWQRWHKWLGKNIKLPLFYEGLHPKH